MRSNFTTSQNLSNHFSFKFSYRFSVLIFSFFLAILNYFKLGMKRLFFYNIVKSVGEGVKRAVFFVLLKILANFGV